MISSCNPLLAVTEQCRSQKSPSTIRRKNRSITGYIDLLNMPSALLELHRHLPSVFCLSSSGGTPVRLALYSVAEACGSTARPLDCRRIRAIPRTRKHSNPIFKIISLNRLAVPDQWDVGSRWIVFNCFGCEMRGSPMLTSSDNCPVRLGKRYSRVLSQWGVVVRCPSTGHKADIDRSTRTTTQNERKLLRCT